VGSLVLAAGCNKMQHLSKPTIGRGGDSDRPTTSVRSAGGIAPTRKAVAGKEEPFTLVAEDKSRCRVPEQQFRETSLGELVWCAWVR